MENLVSNGGGVADNTEVMPYSLTWDHFPHVVQLHIFQFLDRDSLITLGQISASARQAIDTGFGIHVIIRARNIMKKTVPGPREGVQSTVSISILNNILRQCINMRSLEYHPGHENDVQARAEEQIATINGFPDQGYRLADLKQLRFTLGSQGLQHAWGNGAFLLAALPRLPSLTSFQLTLSYGGNGEFVRAHLLLLASLGHFLSNTPNLRDLEFCSYDHVGERVEGEIHCKILRAVLRKYGSPDLKKLMEESILNVDRILPVFLTAARNLSMLQNVNLNVENDLENSLFATLLQNLPQHSPLSYYRIADRTKIARTYTLAMEAEKRKVYKLFAFFHDDRPRAPTPSLYQSLTKLELDCTFPSGTTLYLNAIVIALSLLTDLTMSQSADRGGGRAVVHFDKNSLPNPFSRLEKLVLVRLSVGDLQSPNSSIVGLLQQC